MRVLYSFLPFATGIVVFMIGLVVKIYQPRQTLPEIFLLLCTSVLIWTLGYSINYQTSSPGVALWACRTAFLGVVFIPSTTLHFVIKLLKLTQCKGLVLTAYLISFIFITVIWGDLFFAGITRNFWGYYPAAGPIYIWFVLYYAITFVACVSLLFVSYQRHPSLQIKYVLLAFFIALWSLVDYLPNYGVEIYPFAYLCALGWIATISYAISRHRLFDIEAVIDVIHRDRLAMLGLLSASVNHEIKNPLYIMRGQFDLLKQMEGISKDTRVSRCLEQMDVQIQRIQKLLKMYSGIGTQDQSAGASIQESLRNVIEFLDFEIKRRSIQIEWLTADNIPLVRCARFELESIILNLLLNACQAIGTEGKITVQTEVTSDYVCLRVKDTGPGLSREQQRHIFEPLFTTKPEGGGLGLFITKSMIEKHGGHLKVISEPGQGALFEVSLRRALKAPASLLV